jgi:hypothetical protein
MAGIIISKEEAVKIIGSEEKLNELINLAAFHDWHQLGRIDNWVFLEYDHISKVYVLEGDYINILKAKDSIAREGKVEFYPKTKED